MTDDLEYLGETKKRVRWVAAILTLISPGLGFMYVGQLLKGVTLNLLFLLMLESFVIVFSVLKFFPLLPFAVLVLAWITFTLFAVAAVLREIPESDEYVLKGYNHWMVYTVVMALTFIAPLGATVNFVGKYLVSFEKIDGGAMYPSIRAGDVALVDISGYISQTPTRGELVLIRDPDSGEGRILRVVAIGDDILRIDGEQVFVNEGPLARAALAPGADPAGDLLAVVENNHGANYVISVSPKAFIANNLAPTRLEDGEFFLMADNRSQIPTYSGDLAKIRDSRNFGAISRSDIIGKPLYIAWSLDDQGKTQVDRIGLRVH